MKNHKQILQAEQPAAASGEATKLNEERLAQSREARYQKLKANAQRAKENAQKYPQSKDDIFCKSNKN